MTRPWLALLLLPLLACGDDQPMPAGHTPPPPAATGTSSGPVLTSDDSTTAATSLCACAPEQFCAADYVPGDPEPALEAFTCRAECLSPAAPGFWCFDDSSCCTGTCRPDGLCGSPIGETDGTTTGATGSTTDATGTTTDATGSTTDATGTTGSTTDATTGGASSTGSSTGSSSTG
jgi:hypothetical protein